MSQDQEKKTSQHHRGTDTRECIFTLVRYCPFKDVNLQARNCIACLLGKLENHLFQIKTLLKAIAEKQGVKVNDKK